MSSTTESTPATLTDAARRFAAWREATPRPRRVPAELWSLATECGQRYGVSQTARKLGVDYYALKRRVAPTSAEPQATPTPGFVELALGATTTPPAASAGCVVELADGERRRLRLELADRATAEIVSIARALWDAAR